MVDRVRTPLGRLGGALKTAHRISVRVSRHGGGLPWSAGRVEVSGKPLVQLQILVLIDANLHIFSFSVELA